MDAAPIPPPPAHQPPLGHQRARAHVAQRTRRVVGASAVAATVALITGFAFTSPTNDTSAPVSATGGAGAASEAPTTTTPSASGRSSSGSGSTRSTTPSTTAPRVVPRTQTLPHTKSHAS